MYLCKNIVNMEHTAVFNFFTKLLFLLYGAVVFMSCTTQYHPQAGDLLFVVADDTDFSQAIVQATAQKDSLEFSHVAIVAMQNGHPCVLEASSRNGVVRTEWNDFMTQAPKIGNKPGIVVLRVGIPFPVKEALERAESHLGKAYDWLFFPDNGKIYCSELVYECFRKADGSPLFTARPMNFRDKDGHLPDFWKTLFEKAGEPIPEGVPGTNPNDLSKEDCLEEVYRFF